MVTSFGTSLAIRSDRPRLRRRLRRRRSLAVPLAAAIGLAVGGTLVDQPRPGELQRRPISRTGGYGHRRRLLRGPAGDISDSPTHRPLADESSRSFASWPAWRSARHSSLPFAAWDDARRLPPMPQLIAQIGCAIIPVLFGVRIDRISNIDIAASTSRGSIVIPLSVHLDRRDDQCAELARHDGRPRGRRLADRRARPLRGKPAATRHDGQFAAAKLDRAPGLALAGACLGFLVYNFPPGAHLHGDQRVDVPRLRARRDLDHRRGEDRHRCARPRAADPRHRAGDHPAHRSAALPDAGRRRPHLVHRLLAAGLSVRQIVLSSTRSPRSSGSSRCLRTRAKIIAFAMLVIVIGAVLIFAQWNTNRSVKSEVGSQE